MPVTQPGFLAPPLPAPFSITLHIPFDIAMLTLGFQHVRAPRAAALAVAPTARRAIPRSGVLARATTHSVTFQFPNGTEQVIQCSSDTKIMDAAEASGVKLPNACHGGERAARVARVAPCPCHLSPALTRRRRHPPRCSAGLCGTCCGRVVSGEVDAGEQSYLDDEQLQRGFVLLCMAYPKSDATILTFQEDALYSA